ncbi:MAG TPA: LytTR family DNA-binding domain-containing protein [Pyrinomonadaceae bacterium]|nr:response regulator transcription factor [Chloracidobacterium sp.]MBP9935565.1 response regulator transcription factor [Pyrinomonadaceae bacterium]MBK7801150.1 response regulator transcription factor [Chloracidobacterium sp.]MBK9436473.1 response regulator transcription factor [Chloracidobacterium sp.]MBK9767343.1 response regulator transcription factor [Chloracidobacterium sp.]
MNKLRVIIADDERPAREFLKSILRKFENVEIVGEAENGADAVELIKSLKPDLALLDLKMPEMSGIDAVRLLRRSQLPQVAFVTAHDEFAVQAFELNAVDYLLKPVEHLRLAETIKRAVERLERDDWRSVESEKLRRVADVYDDAGRRELIDRIPVRQRDEILLVPVREVAAIVADGELLHITTVARKKYVINYRLKDLELRLDPSDFVRLSRGTIVNLSMITTIHPMPGGTYLVTLKNGEQHSSSRLQSRILRDRLLHI